MSTTTATIDVAAGLSRVAARLRSIPDAFAITGIVAVAATARVLADLPHTTPRYFPDEYLYSALAQSFGHGSLTIRGEPAHFAALLESVVTAPIWLLDGVATPFRLVQLLHAIVAALAAIPVFLLARRVGLARWQQLGCAALTPFFPVFLFAAYLTADALGALLTLAALAAGVGALVRPGYRREAVFLGIAALATLARFQYVVLFPAFVVAALVVSRGRPLTTARRFRLTALGLAGAAGVALLYGPGRLLGYYNGLLDFHVSVPSLAKWAVTDVWFVALASGVALAPLAMTGLVTALVRPRSDAERAFGALTAALFGFVLLEAILYATNGSPRFQERYFMALLPLLAPLACLGARCAGRRAARLWVCASSLGLAVVAARVPVSDYVIGDGDQDSPFLQAIAWVDRRHGHGNAALVVAVIVTVVALASALVVILVPARAGAVALGLAAAVAVCVSAVAVSEDRQRSENTRVLALGADARFVDRRDAGPVSVLVPRDALRWVISTQLFWNRKTLTRVLTLPKGPDVDAFQNEPVTIDNRGILRQGRAPVTGPLLVEEYASNAQLEDATLLTRRGTASLWRPKGSFGRFVSLTDGRYIDGWLGWPTAMVTVWPGASGTRSGVLCLPFSLPDVGAPTTLELWGPGYHRAVTVASSGHVLVAIPRTVTRPWQLHILTKRPFRIGPRLLAARVERPTFITGKAFSTACR